MAEGTNRKKNSDKAADNMSIETAFTALETLLKEMDDPELPLEEAFNKYNSGLDLIKYCNGSIEKIEQEITILEENQ